MDKAPPVLNGIAELHAHAHAVQVRMYKIIGMLAAVSAQHDASKFTEPEVAAFVKYGPKLRTTAYGSEEYKRNLDAMRPALGHHFANNRHHPEHFGDAGIRGMNLVDVVEMCCDWHAASLRHPDGDARKNFEIATQRFGFSADLKQIFLNTIKFLEAK